MHHFRHAQLQSPFVFPSGASLCHQGLINGEQFLERGIVWGQEQWGAPVSSSPLATSRKRSSCSIMPSLQPQPDVGTVYTACPQPH